MVPDGAEADSDESDLFGTETMAELCARQGQVGRAVAIYRKLIAVSPQVPESWRRRLAALERVKPAVSPPPPPHQAMGPVAPVSRAAAVPVAPPIHRPALVVRQPVRSGQIVRAEKSDLVVLAPVNPGGQVVADGHVHVYGSLRGRAVAGAGGSTEARIFAQRFEAELVGINGVFLTAEDMPPLRLRQPVQVFLRDGACVIEPL